MKTARSPRAYVAFRIVYAVLTMNFVLPAISYMVAPELTLRTLDDVNRALGGGAYPFVEAGQVWHMLAVGNVMTLGWMCALLFVNLRRFYPILPALAFLKAFSALYSAWIGARTGTPVFLAIGVLDGTTTLAMIFFAVRAKRALDGQPPPASPWHVRLLLPGSEQVEQSLERVRIAGIVKETPTTFQILLGVVRMQHRILFRTDTVGTCGMHAVRDTWRARLLHYRFVRLPFLLAERAVAAFDLSGLASSPERVIRHLLGAHHDGLQFAYDLELLALWPGQLELLHEAVVEIVEHDTPRSRWLRDLVVFEGYHEDLLDGVRRALRGESLLTAAGRSDPDLSLRAYLGWCAEQPRTAGAAFRAWRRGDLRFAVSA
jgi:hypothetical protein